MAKREKDQKGQDVKITITKEELRSISGTLLNQTKKSFVINLL